jgi:hypothetical protein
MEKVITTLPDSYASVQSFRPGHHFLTQKLRSVLGNGSYYLQSEKKTAFQTSKNNLQIPYYSCLKFQNYLLTGVQNNIWKLGPRDCRYIWFRPHRGGGVLLLVTKHRPSVVCVGYNPIDHYIVFNF